jgi:hypothetical protein
MDNPANDRPIIGNVQITWLQQSLYIYRTPNIFGNFSVQCNSTYPEPGYLDSRLSGSTWSLG